MSTPTTASPSYSARPSYASYDLSDVTPDNNEFITNQSNVQLDTFNKHTTKRRTVRRATMSKSALEHARRSSMPIIVDAYISVIDSVQLTNSNNNNNNNDANNQFVVQSGNAEAPLTGDNLCLQRKVNCTCSDCIQLNNYLSSNNRRICFDVPIQRRNHIAQMISDYIGSHIVDIQSEWSGSRRVLWCRKLIDRADERDYDSMISENNSTITRSPNQKRSDNAATTISNNSKPTDRLLDVDNVTSAHPLHVQYKYWLNALGWKNSQSLIDDIQSLTQLDIHSIDLLHDAANNIDEIYLGCVKQIIECNYHNKYIAMENIYNSNSVMSNEINELRIKTRFQYDLMHDIQTGRLQCNVLNSIFHSIYGHQANQTIDDLFDVKIKQAKPTTARTYNTADPIRSHSRRKQVRQRLVNNTAGMALLDRLNNTNNINDNIIIDTPAQINTRTAEQIQNELDQQIAIQNIIDVYNERADVLHKQQNIELIEIQSQLNDESGRQHQLWYSEFNKRYDVNNGYDYSLHALYDGMMSRGEIDRSKRILRCEYIPNELSYYPTFHDQRNDYTDIYSLKQLHVCPSQVSGTFADTQPKLHPMCFILTLEPIDCFNITPVQAIDLCEPLLINDTIDYTTCTDSSYVDIDMCDIFNYNTQQCDVSIVDALYAYKRVQDEADRLQVEYDKQQAALVKQQRLQEQSASKQAKFNKQQPNDRHSTKRQISKSYPIHTSGQRFVNDNSNNSEQRLSTVSSISLQRQPSDQSQTSASNTEPHDIRRIGSIDTPSDSSKQSPTTAYCTTGGSRPESAQHSLDTLTARRHGKNTVVYTQATTDITPTNDLDALHHRLNSTLQTITELKNNSAITPITSKREHRRQQTILLRTVQQLYTNNTSIDQGTASSVIDALQIGNDQLGAQLKQQLTEQLSMPVSTNDDHTNDIIDMIVELQQQQEQVEKQELSHHKRQLTQQLQADLIQLSILEQSGTDHESVQQLQKSVQQTQRTLIDIEASSSAGSLIADTSVSDLVGDDNDSNNNDFASEFALICNSDTDDEIEIAADHHSLDVSMDDTMDIDDGIGINQLYAALSLSNSLAELDSATALQREQQLQQQLAVGRASINRQVNVLFDDIFNDNTNGTSDTTRQLRGTTVSVTSNGLSVASSRLSVNSTHGSSNSRSHSRSDRPSQSTLPNRSVKSSMSIHTPAHTSSINTLPPIDNNITINSLSNVVLPRLLSTASTMCTLDRPESRQLHRLHTAPPTYNNTLIAGTTTLNQINSERILHSTKQGEDVQPQLLLQRYMYDMQSTQYQHTATKLQYIFNKLKWSIQSKLLYIRKYCVRDNTRKLNVSIALLSHVAMLVNQREYMIHQCQQLNDIHRQWFTGALNILLAIKCKTQLDKLLNQINRLTSEIKHYAIILHNETGDAVEYDGHDYVRHMFTDVQQLFSNVTNNDHLVNDEPMTHTRVDISKYFQSFTPDTLQADIKRLHQLLCNQWRYAQDKVKHHIQQRKHAVKLVRALQQRASTELLLHTSQSLPKLNTSIIINNHSATADNCTVPIAVLGRQQHYNMLLYKAKQLAQQSMYAELQRQVAQNVHQRIRNGDVYDNFLRSMKPAIVEEAKTAEIAAVILTPNHTVHDKQWNNKKSKLAAKLKLINSSIY